tara:strand:- start:268 stop:432 length:165 start_codon:yes stop_codon:yes gene_type:complete
MNIQSMLRIDIHSPMNNKQKKERQRSEAERLFLIVPVPLFLAGVFSVGHVISVD